MKNKDKILLIYQATRLTALGVRVERARNNLKKLVDEGVPYDDTRMIKAVEYFNRLEKEWKCLEAEHIKLKQKLGIE